MPILRFYLATLLALSFTALAQQGPSPAALAAAQAYGLPAPPAGGTVSGPFELDVPNVLVYVDEARGRITMLFIESHTALLADINSDGTGVIPRFAFNPSGYYVINGNQLSAPMYQPPPGLDEQWPMVVPIYQRIAEISQQLAASGSASDSAALDALLDQIISGGNASRSQITQDGFAGCIDHYENGIYQGCW